MRDDEVHMSRTYQLTSEQWHVLDDAEAHAPFRVTGQLDNGREKALRQLSHADDLRERKGGDQHGSPVIEEARTSLMQSRFEMMFRRTSG